MTERFPTRVSDSRALAMQASPGLLVQSIAGRATWAEYEPLVNAMHEVELLGPRYLVINRVAPTSVRDVPDDDFRKLAAKSVVERHGDKVAAFAYVVIGEGFIASIARAVITGIGVVARSPYPEKTFGELEAAAEWLSPHLAGGPSPGEIAARVDQLLRAQAHV